MPTIQHTAMRSYGYAMFQAAGLPADQARIVTDHLVDANLTGHDSHGIIRIPGYIRSIAAGKITPVGKLKVVRETPASVVIDGEGGQGIVICTKAMEMAIERAKQTTFGAVAVHQCSHIGRLGAYPPMAAEQDCIGILLLNGGSRFTAPFGGTSRRLPPNPIAMAVPSQSGPVMMLDITTSMAAGGKVEVYAARNQQVPTGWLVDPEGNEVRDPHRFQAGEMAMLPLGGASGHKGYGLGMMIDAIAGGLSWAGCSSDKPTRGGSGFVALAIKIDSFIDVDEYKKEVQILIDWAKSSRTAPGVKKIYYPGEIEEELRAARSADGIPVEETTWSRIAEAATEVGVAVPAV